MRMWKDEGEVMQQPRHFFDSLMLHVTLTKAGGERGNSSLCFVRVSMSACVHVHRCRHCRGIKVGRRFMKLLVAANGKCLFICTELQSLRVAGGRFAVEQSLQG